MAWYADKLIAPSGGDYTKLSDFEAAYDGVDISGTDGVRARLQGTDGTTSNSIYWTGWQAGQSSSCKIVVEADSGYETDGTDGDGSSVATITKVFSLYGSSNGDLYFEVHGIEFDAGSVNSDNSFTGGDIEITKCLFHDYTSPATIDFGSTATLSAKIGGCIVRDDGHTYGTAIRSRDADVTLTIKNTTCANCNFRGIDNSAGTISAHNVAVVNCGDDIYGTVTETDSTLLTEDDGDLSNTDGVDFTAPSTDDYTIADTDSALYHAGTTVSDTWFTSRCSTDFDGTTWDASTPSVGAWEYAAGDTTTVNSDVTLVYDLLNTAQSDLTAKFDVLNRINSDLTFVYDMAGRIQSDLTCLYDMAGIVQSDLTAKYGILNRVQSDLKALFDILSTLQVDLTLVYDVANSVVSDLKALFDIRATTQSDLVAIYDMAGKVRSDLTLLFAILNDIDLSKYPWNSLAWGMLAWDEERWKGE